MHKGGTAEFQSNFFSTSSHHKSAEQHGHVICPYHLGGASVSPPSTCGQMFSVKPALVTHSLPEQGVRGPLAAALFLLGHEAV